MVTWLRMVGWDAQQLTGGYKAYRHHVVEQLRQRVPQLRLRVVCGATGSAKTRLLHALQAQGAQVLDLEGLACHKGSLLRAVPGVEQPSQKAFETQLLHALEQLDTAQPIFIEGESAKIGRLAVPLELIAQMRTAPVLEVQATPEVRLAFLLRDYAYLGTMCRCCASGWPCSKSCRAKRPCPLASLGAGGRFPQFVCRADGLALRPAVPALASGNFQQWAQRQSVQASNLSEAGIVDLARQVLKNMH